jgi:hypothetical protein
MRVALSVLLMLLFVPTFAGTERLALYLPDAPVSIAPVPLDSRAPTRRRLGGLTYLGGWVLSSWDPAFGGFSSMSIVGDRFFLLSDGGNYLKFRMTAQGGLADVHTGALPGGPGSGWDKADRDSESQVFDPATGRLWVGFEQYNAIYRYAPGLGAVEKSVRPRAMADWQADYGPESMARLHDGSFIVIAERNPKATDSGQLPSPALHFTGDPTEAPSKGFRFRYVPPRGFSPTDAVELPDGRIALLNRRFRLRDRFTAVLTIIDGKAIRPGATLVGREVARFDGSVLHDNFEALAVTREGSATILWVASDDNQQWWERSLLLKFRLDM